MKVSTSRFMMTDPVKKMKKLKKKYSHLDDNDLKLVKAHLESREEANKNIGLTVLLYGLPLTIFASPAQDLIKSGDLKTASLIVFVLALGIGLLYYYHSFNTTLTIEKRKAIELILEDRLRLTSYI